MQRNRPPFVAQRTYRGAYRWLKAKSRTRFLLAPHGSIIGRSDLPTHWDRPTHAGRTARRWARTASSQCAGSVRSAPRPLAHCASFLCAVRLFFMRSAPLFYAHCASFFAQCATGASFFAQWQCAALHLRSAPLQVRRLARRSAPHCAMGPSHCDCVGPLCECLMAQCAAAVSAAAFPANGRSLSGWIQCAGSSSLAWSSPLQSSATKARVTRSSRSRRQSFSRWPSPQLARSIAARL